jgi:outer membrane lipoprotein carrier protein
VRRDTRRRFCLINFVLAAATLPLGWAAWSLATEVAGDPSLDSLHGSAKLDAVIDRVVGRQRALRSLRADFVQVRQSTMLLDTVRSTGEFYYRAPDRVRWDYRQPDPLVVLFADDIVTTYDPDGRRAERVKVSSRDRRFVQALGGTLPLDDLLEYFRIRFEDSGAPDPYLFELRPTLATVKKRLDSLRLEVDRELLLPVVVEFHEADGDSTRYEFHRLEIDPEIEASRFVLELDPGIAVETIDASAGIG